MLSQFWCFVLYMFIDNQNHKRTSVPVHRPILALISYLSLGYRVATDIYTVLYTLLPEISSFHGSDADAQGWGLSIGTQKTQVV